MLNILQAATDSVSGLLSSLTLKDVLSGIWAPFSIFVGAWVAFAFNNERATRERIDKEIGEGNLALSILAQFQNLQVQYLRNYIDPHKNKPDAWFQISPGPALDNGVRVELNKNSLGFLLQSNSAIWQQVTIEEQRFYQVRSLIEARNTLLENAWAKLEVAGVKHGAKQIPFDFLEKAIGPVLFHQLKNMGDSLMALVPQNVASSMDAISALRAELVKAYPKRSFITVVPPPALINPVSNSGITFTRRTAQ
jgi:hypothetical protein